MSKEHHLEGEDRHAQFYDEEKHSKPCKRIDQTEENSQNRVRFRQLPFFNIKLYCNTQYIQKNQPNDTFWRDSAQVNFSQNTIQNEFNSEVLT